jgi:hypothetical protein
MILFQQSDPVASGYQFAAAARSRVRPPTISFDGMKFLQLARWVVPPLWVKRIEALKKTRELRLSPI